MVLNVILSSYVWVLLVELCLLLMFATLSSRTVFRSNLSTCLFQSALNIRLASMCTAELHKEGIIKLQLYYIVEVWQVNSSVDDVVE